MLYKIVYRDQAYHVVLATETTLLGYEIRPYGSLADCLERAELRATRHARQASGGPRGGGLCAGITQCSRSSG